MQNRRFAQLSVLAAALALMVTAPGQAQERAKEKETDSDAPASVERRPQLERRETEVEARGNAPATGVPRGWCQGRGNPHNTVANCGVGALNNGGAEVYRNYDEAHTAFHRALDQKYGTLAAERPLDIRRQLELRSLKSAEHERWHEQIGRRHD